MELHKIRKQINEYVLLNSKTIKLHMKYETIKHVQEKAKLDRLREDDTNGGIREKKVRFKSKIFVNNYISLKFRYMYV
jgi:hypothetical protein